MRTPTTIAIIIAFIFNTQLLQAEDPVRAKHLNSAIVFDGFPEAEEWKDVPVLNTYMLQPDPNGVPTEKTEILIAYTDNYLWIGGRFYDESADLIKANTKKRDDFGDDYDFFGIMIDGLNSNETGFIFCTTPMATRLDMTIFNDGRDQMPFNASWNTFWDVKTSVTDEGWFMEMRIPFSSLRFVDNNGKVSMGVSAYRWIPHKNEMVTFPKINPKHGRFAKQKPSLASDVIFENIMQKNPVYITPYILAGKTNLWDINDVETDYIHSRSNVLEPGLDVKYSINNNLTLDLTVNTDFAQVENDDQQVNMSRFSLFYPEKRQFFQERSDIFNFSLGRDANAFYSRSIGLYEGEKIRILGGGRLTGKIGNWDLGLIDMQTAESSLLSSENFGVFRVKRRIINPYSYAGGIITSRIATNGTYNLVYGADTYIRVFGDDYFDFKISQVHDSELNNDNLLDNSFIRINWEKRTEEGFSYKASFNWSGENYQPGMGFLRRYNYYVAGGRLKYGWIPGPESKLLSHLVYFKYVSYYSTTGNMETGVYGPGYMFTTKNKMSGSLDLEYRIEDLYEDFYISDDVFIPTGDYKFISLKGKLDSPNSKALKVRSEYEIGQFYDGYRFSLKLKPQWSVSPSIKLEGQYQYNVASFSERNTEFLNHIAQLKLTYMLNTKLSASAFIQYNSSIDATMSNLRVRYNPREGNDFFIVYNEGRNYDLNRETPVLPEFSERTLLVKYTYTFAL